LNGAELIEKVLAPLDIQSAADRFSGAVLIAQEDQPILATARGYAIHSNVLPNCYDWRHFSSMEYSRIRNAAQ